MVIVRDLQPGAYIHPTANPAFRKTACVVHKIKPDHLGRTDIDLTLDTGERSTYNYSADDEWVWLKLNLAFIPPTPKEKP